MADPDPLAELTHDMSNMIMIGYVGLMALLGLLGGLWAVS